jgi:mono/diheme cytochrome c family protein
MKPDSKHSQRFIRAAVAAFALLAVGSLVAVAQADDTKPVVAKKLTGAELYAINCNRCHPERYPTEFNSAQWQTIMIHMRVRANLPAKQAKEILKYMKEEAGN